MFFVLVFVVLLLIYLSCGSGGGSSAEGDLSTKEPVPDSSALFTVRFRPQWLHQAQFAGFYVAHAKGMYRDYGLNVIIQEGGPDHPAAQSLINGESDFVSLFLLAAMMQAEKGHHLVNVAQISQKSSFMLAAKKSSGIEEPKDLEGRKVGLWHSEFREIAHLFFRQQQVNVEIIPIDWTINLLLQGAVDAMNVMRYNEYNQLIQAGLDPSELTVFAMKDYGLNIPEDGIYCTRDFYRQYPKIARDFAEATMDGWMYAINNPEEALEIVLGVMRRSFVPANRPHQRWMLSVQRDVILARPGKMGELDREIFDVALKMLMRQGELTVPLDYKEFTGNAAD